MLTSGAIKARAREVGFDLCGIAPAAAFPELGFLREWLDRGFAGTMAYLPRTASRRADVRNVLPSARSVIVTGSVYDAGSPYSTEVDDPTCGEIARYALSRDYHHLIGERLETLLEWMRAAHPQPFEARVYVDTGPVQEKVYAQYAGVGWIGKNTCVISPERGSWLLLGSIIASLPLEADAPSLDQCGTCTLCLEACPTGAFVEPHVLDATRCISYLTIEYRGAIPDEYRSGIGNHIFGCDVCQEVCPWNSAASKTADPAWASHQMLNRANLIDLWRRSDADLADLIEGTPITRAGILGLRRNLAVALGNSGDSRAAEALEDAAPDGDTRGSELVGEHIAWARAKLSSR